MGTEVADKTTNIDLARKMLGELPDGARFYASSWYTIASGRNDWQSAEERRRAVVAELKEASADESVGRISIIIVYDDTPKVPS